MTKRTYPFLHRFWRSQDGSAMPLVGLAAFALLGAAGIAIDMGRVQIVQSRMSSALDAAGLAAAATASTTDATAETKKYFYANFPKGYMGSVNDDPTVVPNANNVLILDVAGSVKTTFMKLFGVSSVPVKAHAEITRANKGMELVLVIDTTGSMDDSAGGGVTKLQAAKSASTDLINILYGTTTTQENLWVGLVPFSQAVNIGTSHAAWTTTGSFNWGTTSWAGCVDAREASSRDTTDDPPSTALFPRYYWPCHTTNNAWYGTNSSRNNCNTGSGLSYKSGLGSSLGPNKYCSQAMTPMSKTKTTVLNAISTLNADGNTHVVMGAVWAWRMLSPRWRTLWGGDMNTDSLPQDYNTPLMNKVVILMTDGDNTIDNSSRGAYWYLSDGHLGTTSSSTAVTQLNTRLTTVCTRMKNNNIIVYTIAFGTSISTSAKNILQSCASKPEFYFASPTGADLQTAFHIIGDSLANLRISK